MKKPKPSNLSESKDRSRDAAQCYEDPVATAAEAMRKKNTKKRKAEIQNRDQTPCNKNDPKMEQKEKGISEIDMLFGRLKEKTPKNKSQDQALKKKEVGGPCTTFFLSYKYNVMGCVNTLFIAKK